MESLVFRALRSARLFNELVPNQKNLPGRNQ